jgi:hypothetical protein
MENHQLDIQNLTSIGADNANVNFGKQHSVFKLFKDRCPRLVKGILKCSLLTYLHIFELIFV